MATPAACALSSSLVAAVRVSTAPPRRPASSFSRVHIPPAFGSAPRSLSVSLSVLRPRAHRGASDLESAGDDTGFGFSPCDPAVDHPYDILSADDDADDGLVLHVPFVEDPFELVATTGLGLGEVTHDEGEPDLVPRVPASEEPHEVDALVPRVPASEEPHEVDALVLHVPFFEDPFELVATTGLGLGEVTHDEGESDLVPRVPASEEPHEVDALVPRVPASEEPHEVDGLVLHVPPVEDLHELTATMDLGEGAPDVVDEDGFLYPTSLTNKDLDEYVTTDFSRAAINERFRLESKEAKSAVAGAVAGVLRPLRELVHDVRSLRRVFDMEEFQIGMPFGAIMTCMGIYQLWKLSPSTCIDVAMYYAFYKLSVIAADVRRRGFSPDWIIRIKLGIMIAVLAKVHGNKGLVPLDFIRLAIFFIYGYSVGWEVLGLKKYASRSFLHVLFHFL